MRSMTNITKTRPTSKSGANQPIAHKPKKTVISPAQNRSNKKQSLQLFKNNIQTPQFHTKHFKGKTARPKTPYSREFTPSIQDGQKTPLSPELPATAVPSEGLYIQNNRKQSVLSTKMTSMPRLKMSMHTQMSILPNCWDDSWILEEISETDFATKDKLCFAVMKLVKRYRIYRDQHWNQLFMAIVRCYPRHVGIIKTSLAELLYALESSQ